MGCGTGFRADNESADARGEFVIVNDSVCGILFDENFAEPKDQSGCILPWGHDGPHEFTDPYGQHWRWETDLGCTCSHCMHGSGDFCATYWAISA